MSLSTSFRGQLGSLAADFSGQLVVEAGDRKLYCDIQRLDILAVAFGSLKLATSELAGVSMTDVERLSTELSKRLTYLMEPITPIERDQEQCVVQMRSNPPQQDDDGRNYYELVVCRGGELALARYQKQDSSPRRCVPAVLSREALFRLVDDFDAALSEYTAGNSTP